MVEILGELRFGKDLLNTSQKDKKERKKEREKGRKEERERKKEERKEERRKEGSWLSSKLKTSNFQKTL